MKEYVREYPLFALCGLNCGLCPRFHTEGSSRCPGCGGAEFHLKHPSCAVITCAGRHGSVAFCFQCAEYPCQRYARLPAADSFISYRNVIADFAKAKAKGLPAYMAELQEKLLDLEYLIESCNDGRRKAFFCAAVNLLPLEAVREVMETARGLEA